MNNVIYRILTGFFLTILLAAGTSVPISAVPGTDFRISQAGADIADLSRQFRSETPAVILFASGRIDLSAEARRRLDVQADWIRSHPNVRIRVYGHAMTDGNPAYNMALSLRRANAVVDYLAGKGVAQDRLEAMVSFGAEFPVSGGDDPAAAGRRTITRIIGFSPQTTTADALSTLRAVRFGAVISERGKT